MRSKLVEYHVSQRLVQPNMILSSSSILYLCKYVPNSSYFFLNETFFLYFYDFNKPGENRFWFFMNSLMKSLSLMKSCFLRNLCFHVTIWNVFCLEKFEHDKYINRLLTNWKKSIITMFTNLIMYHFIVRM